MTPVRCPKCKRLLGKYKGKGEVLCPRCLKGTIVYFDTELKIVKIEKTECR